MGRIVDVARGPLTRGGQGLPEVRSLGNVGPVASAGTGDLSWTALADVSSYVIYWGTVSGAYTNSQDVGDVTTYQVESLSPTLSPGVTYYLIIKGYDGSGYSDASDEISLVR